MYQKFLINLPRFGFLYNWLIILLIALLVKKHFQICEKLNQSSYHCNVSVFGVLFQPNLDIAMGFKLLNSSIFNILYLKAIYDFPIMRGGQRSHGTFPKIHPFWRHHLSLWTYGVPIKIIVLAK